MFTMCNAILNACWDTATARHHWTEQWRRDQVRWHPLPNRTEFINFSKRFLISDNSSFCSLILSAIDLQCHVFFLLESFCWMSVFVCKRHFWWCHIWRHRHVTMLQCSAKFPNILVHWSIWIIHAKNTKLWLNLSKLCVEYCGLFLSQTRCIAQRQQKNVSYLPFLLAAAVTGLTCWHL